MELIYRGIKYKIKKSKVIKSVDNKQHKIIYPEKSAKKAICPQFPASTYFKQLFSSWNPPVFNPVKYWYKHKSKYLESCWEVDVAKQLDYCYTIAVKTTSPDSQQGDRPIALKYRGVTYYK